MTLKLLGTALPNFYAAVQEKVVEFDRLDNKAFLDLMRDLCRDGGLVEGELIGNALIRLAGLGSIEAIAALISANSPQEMTLAAMKAFAARLPEVIDDILATSLLKLAHEFIEEEIAAGRMYATKDPATGKTMYVTKPPAQGDSK